MFADSVVGRLTALVLVPVISDGIWQAFGFRNRPRVGSFFYGFLSDDRRSILKFVRCEILGMTLATLARNASRSLERPWARSVLGGVIGSIVSDPGVLRAFHLGDVEDALLTVEKTVTAYLRSPSNHWGRLFIERSPRFSSPKMSARLLVGAARLFEPGSFLFALDQEISALCRSGEISNIMHLPPEYSSSIVGCTERILDGIS